MFLKNIIKKAWWRLSLVSLILLLQNPIWAQTFSPSSTVTVSTAGNNTAYTTIYLLTNSAGLIQNQITLSGGTFTAPATGGNYNVYAVNYDTGSAPSFTPGLTNISAITGACLQVGGATALNVCRAAGSSITFSTTGNNTTGAYTTTYVLTNAAGIIQNTVTSPFTAPTTGGTYKLYTINYKDAAPTLTNGTNISAIGGACTDVSAAIDFEVCAPTCRPAGSSITFATTGNNTTSGYTTTYVLTDAAGIIQNTVTSPFTAPTTGGTYKLYTINYTDTAPTLTNGTNISAIGGTCTDVSTGINFDVCPAVCGTATLVLTPTDKNNLTVECSGSNWTYYGLPTDGTSEVYFAVNWNPLGLTGAASNDAAKTAATASITVNTNPYSAAANSTTGEDSWSMRRYWNVDLNGSSIDVTNPVQVRFYYDIAEKDAITTAASDAASASTAPVVVVEPFTWFKTVSGAFVPSTNVTAEAITGCIDLIDVNATPALTENNQLYAEFHGLTSFSGGTGGTGVSPAGGSPLPVKMLSFTGAANGKVNDLKWTTASEQNTAFHIVERSATGNNDWQTIGKVAAIGTTNVSHTYTLADKNPLPQAYYRIHSLDYDGKYQLSNVIRIDRSSDNFATVLLYPNPTTDVVNIAYETASNATVNLTLLDALGRILETKTLTPSQGLNTTTFDLSPYPDAIYILLMENGTVRTSHRLAKNRK